MFEFEQPVGIVIGPFMQQVLTHRLKFPVAA